MLLFYLFYNIQKKSKFSFITKKDNFKGSILITIEQFLIPQFFNNLIFEL